MNAALVAVIAKYGRGELAARITVDARVVDKEVAGNIFGKAALNTSHWYLT